MNKKSAMDKNQHSDLTKAPTFAFSPASMDSASPAAAATTASPNPNQMNFPVVGIGASAGGLEALQAFFENMPVNPGAAFVIVQHLSPDHQSFMGELLTRYTSIPVAFIQEGDHLEPNHIYLIPPKVNITLREGILHQHEILGRGLNLPIDIFFRSLAEDQQNNAVAIILSGAGSDGTLGIRAIKENGGFAMVQDPHDAKFDGMPKSALATNMIDLVSPADEMAKKLADFLSHPLFTHAGEAKRLPDENQQLFDRILSILKEEKKVDFSAYRRETLVRRLEKRISINRFEKLSDYVDYLTKTPQEVDTLFHEILIGVTRFFRDEDAFSMLEKNCFPAIFRNYQNSAGIRIWVSSCSTGEEAYSIAILLKEYMLHNRILADVKIFATDIDERSLKFAAVGFYPQNVVADIPPKYLAKYFSPRGSGYLVNPDVRHMIIFANQNLVENPPFFKMDLITCRNFLIYIDLEAQKKVISSFYAGLKTDGFLFLGPSESLGDLAEGFHPVNAKTKLFQKRDGFAPEYTPKSAMPLHLSMLEHHTTKHERFPSMNQENSELLAILEKIDSYFLHPSLVINSNFEIIYTIRDGGNLLRLPPGRVTTNLLKILPKDLGLIFSSLFRRSEGREEILSAEVTLNDHPTTVQCKHIVIETGNQPASYYYISFEEIAARKALPAFPPIAEPDLSKRYQERIDDLEFELRQHKESLRAAVEELETSNEEIQASNEELVASNEELQSSNEELQSVNEELYTVNIEHVRKLDEITELNLDYDNLLSNTQIGTLYLDSRLIIRKISQLASKITNILQTDIGRPIGYFSLKSLYPEFVKDVNKVNDTKSMVEKELLWEGKSYFMRIVPYLVEENTYKGLIISFVDLTECKTRAIEEAYANQKKVQVATAQLEAATVIARMAFFQINTQTRECTGSKYLNELWPLKNGCVPPPEEWIHPDDLAEVNSRFEELRNGAEQILVTFRSSYFGNLRYYRMAASMDVHASGGHIITGVIQDTTRVFRDQQRIDAREKFWLASIDSIPVLFYCKNADDEFRYTQANRTFLDFVGKTREEVIGKTDDEITPNDGTYRKEDLEALQSDGPISLENSGIDREGNLHYFHTIKKRASGLDGRNIIIGICGDVTEQRLFTNDLKFANECMTSYFDEDATDTAIQQAMQSICHYLGASHGFLMSFDHKNMTVTCEEEYVAPERGQPFFGHTNPIPFSEEDEWYKFYQKSPYRDIPDISAHAEASRIFKNFCNTSGKYPALSLYSSSFRRKNHLVGAVNFVFTEKRPPMSPQRFSNLMAFAAYLFRNALAHLASQK